LNGKIFVALISEYGFRVLNAECFPRIVIYFLLLLSIGSCDLSKDIKFRIVPSDESGILFRNELSESVDLNIFNYMYFYNGGGVAVGDVNGDSLLDIYFTANTTSNELYLNKGGLSFQDITKEAGVAGFKGWATGVTMADVNSDGLLDIYVCYLGDHLNFEDRNQLFINKGNDKNGVPVFSDEANSYGLDLTGFSTQALFFDYDNDNDLDMFMLNHSLHENGTFGKSGELRYKYHPLAGDRLMRNDNGYFVDVSKQSGIYQSALGYGLGVVASDVNMDGWMDIYVGNDFHENDYLYINQQDGTFKEILEHSMPHTSRYTMGCDMADFNNDGFPDILSMDMLPADPQILKSSAAEDPYDVFYFKKDFGYNVQFTRNSLQLNNGDGTFSEIGLFAGISATDWSWATFFADFNLDGHKDIFVSNGIVRRSNDLDYINFISADSIQMKLKSDMTEKEMVFFKKMPQVKIPNFLFINNGDSTFTNLAPEWGLTKASYSSGAAYADLDNDGDIDIVTNNLNEVAFLYENQFITQPQKPDAPGYLKFSFEGPKGNTFGVGAKVILYKGDKIQIQEVLPTRGYQSSVDYRLTFGLGSTQVVDSVIVIWPNGTFQKVINVERNQHLTLKSVDATGKFSYNRFHFRSQFFENVTDDIAVDYIHKENSFVEFNREGLLPHMLSAEGPAVAVGDVNNDGLDDIYLGGAKWQISELWLQTGKGTFVRSFQEAFKNDSTYEDVDAILIDVDNDNDKDLVVASGGNEFWAPSVYTSPRLYINDGKGEFTRSTAFFGIYLTGSCVSAADVDKDGDVDLFFGARAIPWRYGKKPDSYLLMNDGKGNFSDVTSVIAPEFRSLGFVKDAKWSDIDGDKDMDLIVASEWSSLLIFVNENGMLTKSQNNGLELLSGWWNVITPFDFDKDGDMDFLAGNLGLNSKLKATQEEPVRMYVNDFDGNGTSEQVLTHIVNGKEYPFNTRDEMIKQIPSLKKKYLSYKKYAEADIIDVFGEKNIDSAKVYAATNFQHGFIRNEGNGKFTFFPLPNVTQFSWVNDFLVDDYNSDGNFDVLVVGNFYPINIQMGQYDASYGQLLLGNGRGGFIPVAQQNSGFSVNRETRKLRKILAGDKHYFMAIRNNSSVEFFK
jgi:enediyne biosynthesis protein E4